LALVYNLILVADEVNIITLISLFDIRERCSEVRKALTDT